MMNQKKIVSIVTGANGFVGRHLVDALVEKGNQVVAVSGPHLNQGRSFSVREDLIHEHADLSETDGFREIVVRYQPDEVYHLAGIAVTHGVSAESYYHANVLGAYRWAEVVQRECGDECAFLFVSSASVYGSLSGDDFRFKETDTPRPTSLYGASKASAEAHLWTLLSKGLNLKIARPFNHTGPGQQAGFLCPDLAARIKKEIVNQGNGELRISVGRMDAIRDFMDVRDVVRAYILIMESAATGSVVNVCSGIGISVREMAEILAQETRLEQAIKYIQSDTLVRGEPDKIVGDDTYLRSLGEWTPHYTLKETLRDLWLSF
ncbi:NAD-dependent epimerase/dehydratase family protein [Ferroacidibacillus organovorans]|uniref:NAD(P)-binding domain-containing protein n=1 Tax=Ferroacidibacillus organovorans TaxID=1765683 RepID=A0A101XPV4_9BACL|nr:GDP-mannose 4,6-dehydratase [Ferroacidibacillus organovorans]KUO95216.1 hypothetical protein ATW55_13820 [Ferroacidibacillus organovorans]